VARPFLVRRGALLRGAALLPLAGVAACGSEDPPSGSGGPDATASSSRGGPSPSASPSPSSPEPSDTGTPAGPPNPRVAGELATGLAVPWGIAFLPDGSALVSCRDSFEIVHVRPGRTQVVGRVPGVVSQVESSGEGGLLGIALHPEHPRQPWLYAYLTTDSDNRVVRMRWTGPGGRLGAPQVLLDGIETETFHNGGGLLFGTDGHLYIATGDAGVPERAQDTDSVNGKILRLTDTGSVPGDNPFGNAVWSYGHRNVEGLALDRRGRLWASEFGDHAFDEVNRIVRGGNYGWPLAEGRDGGSGSTGGGDWRDPLAQWPTDDASPAGIAIARGHAWLGALQGECVLAVDLATGRSERHVTGHGRIRLVAAAPDGSLWVGTSNRDGRGSVRDGDDRLLRVTL